MAPTRRGLLKGAAALAGTAALTPRIFAKGEKEGASPKAAAPQDRAAVLADGKERPNIIFIMADQLAASFVGCYGSGVNSTPNLDRLAKSGVRFEHCYTHAPACAPNRASIFTGRSIEVHGMVQNNLHLRPEHNPLFTQLLQTNGYRTGGFGKFHFTEMPLYPCDNMSPYGFDEFVMSEDPKFGTWLDWIKKDHPEYYGAALSLCWPQPYSTRDPKLTAEWKKAYAQYMQPRCTASEWAKMFTSPLPKDLQQSVFIMDKSLDFIKKHKQAFADDPYFCFISFVAPHDPYDPPEPYDKMFDPKDMKPPVPMVGDQYTNKLLENHRDALGFRKISKDVEAIKKLRAYYHGNIKLIDDQIGRLQDYLEKTNQMDNTILVFTTDHGDMMGDHALITKWCMHYENSIHCPLIVNGASIEKGVVSKRLTSSMDVFSTICDFAHVDLRPPVESRSFAPTCRGAQDDHGWPVMTIQLGPIRGIMTRDKWRLTKYAQKDEGQMYDLTKDPDEQNNLYYQANWASKRAELYEEMTVAYMGGYMTNYYHNLPQENGRPCLYGPKTTYQDMQPLPW